ncbi:proteasome assembly chaperone 2-like isoform X1 [Tachypleus tridentatus]|uniref:proteasome assembly chaperone 2-like isoform X1 n=1 Tax=Tachypleus tridentatus TaxID=6853 RepID=UPI003FD698FA
MYFTARFQQNLDWTDHTLILPAVAVGNVGQLTVDLLLSTLEVELVGRLHSTAFLPLVGPDPFYAEPKGIVTSCQVYHCLAHKLVIVQQRAPIAMNRRREFRTSLIQWIQEHYFKQVILLSSCFAHFRTDKDLLQIPLKFLCTPDLTDSVGSYLHRSLGWRSLERRDPFTYSEDSAGVLHMPGSGITRSLFEECSTKKVRLVVLLLYCSEGDNVPDAFTMADQLNSWLQLIPGNDSEKGKSWKVPASWNLMFGNHPPKNIY